MKPDDVYAQFINGNPEIIADNYAQSVYQSYHTGMLYSFQSLTDDGSLARNYKEKILSMKPSKKSFKNLIKLYEGEDLTDHELEYLYKSGLADAEGNITESGICKAIECYPLKVQLAKLNLNLDVADVPDLAEFKTYSVENKFSRFIDDGSFITNYEGGFLHLVMRAYFELAYDNIMGLGFIEKDHIHWRRKSFGLLDHDKVIYENEHFYGIAYQNPSHAESDLKCPFGFDDPLRISMSGYKRVFSKCPPCDILLSVEERSSIVNEFKNVVSRTDLSDLISAASKILPSFKYSAFYNRAFRNKEDEVLIEMLENLLKSLGKNTVDRIINIAFENGVDLGSGFPDITKVVDGQMELYEVKTSDKLRYYQIYFIRNLLEDISFAVKSFKVVKVNLIDE